MALVLWIGYAVVLLLATFSLLWRKRHNYTPVPSHTTQVEKNKQRKDTDYSDIFPPSQRSLLKDVKGVQECSNVDLSSVPLLGMKTNFETATPDTYIFSGFSVGEIKALGRFPDYAKLTGVPLPSPANFDVNQAAPRPYRPFRWNYHQTMAYHKLDIDYWIELESTYRERVRQRQDLFSQHGEGVLQALPGSELACKELMEMVIQFLCARYPQHFHCDGRTLSNYILQTNHDLATTDPLHVLLDNVPEDFALILRDEDTGRYVFRAGIICSSVGWNLADKMGLDMSAIHGPVPDYEKKLAFSLDRFFTKMKASNPIQRAAWGLEIGQPLYLPADHPDLAHRTTQNPDLNHDNVYLRVDWQTLRRLPLSGAVAFNFKALFTPISEFRDEPYVPSLLLKVLNEGSREILEYKGTWHVEHVVKPALEEFAEFQISEGLIERDWEPQTLDESPLYPGWEAKWTNEA